MEDEYEASLSQALDLAITYHRDHKYLGRNLNRESFSFNVPWTILTEIEGRLLESRWKYLRVATYTKRPETSSIVVVREPKIPFKDIAREIAQVMITRHQIREAVCKFCFMGDFELDKKSEKKVLKAFTKFLMELHAEASVLCDQVENKEKKKRKPHHQKGFLLILWRRIRGEGDVKQLRAEELIICREREMLPSEFVRIIAKAENIAQLETLSGEERKALEVGRDFIHSSESLKGLKARLRVLRKQVVSVEAAE
ncbi:hypothetical protein BDZ45DRAFT_390526 [Acephala macrosclerotiorum]|nr:hypothetical protein BDZ45DRAFT_390526 [Acephala macrosclerotiorum]